MTMAPSVHTFYLARHGNRQDFVDLMWRHYAQHPDDPDLSEDGTLQAQALAARLKDEDISAVYASPFLRTVHTANYVAELLNLPLLLEDGVCEWLNPAWFKAQPRRLARATLLQRYPRIDTGYGSVLHPRFPEDWEAFAQRCRLTAQVLVEQSEGGILVVGHGASVIGLAQGLLEQPVDIGWDLCSITKLAWAKGRWNLELNGDCAHLPTKPKQRRMM